MCWVCSCLDHPEALGPHPWVLLYLMQKLRGVQSCCEIKLEEHKEDEEKGPRGKKVGSSYCASPQNGEGV